METGCAEEVLSGYSYCDAHLCTWRGGGRRERSRCDMYADRGLVCSRHVCSKAGCELPARNYSSYRLCGRHLCSYDPRWSRGHDQYCYYPATEEDRHCTVHGQLVRAQESAARQEGWL